LDDSFVTEPDGCLNAGRRSDLRRARRRAEALGPVEVDLRAPVPGAVADLMAELIMVEAGGWKDRRGTSLRTNDRMREFFLGYADQAAARGALRLGFLRVGGEAAACSLAVDWGGRRWLFKIGYDERFARCSPGMLLMVETLRDAAKQGMRSVELLGTEEPWTRVWTRESRECVDVTCYGPHPSSVPAVVGDLGWRASRPVRLRLHRLARDRAKRRTAR
jgi:CelD/BcsL family acetyltransferase involved in cellulose biosynthesis